VVIAAFATREGIEAWNGDACCRPVAQLVTGEQMACEGAHCQDGCCDD
jgi:hypothetical protein